MRRRRFLATLGAGAMGAIAGCPGGSDPSTPTADVPAIDDQDCPPYAIDLDGVVCSHTVESTNAAVYLDANQTTAVLSNGTPASEITLTLHNESTTDLEFNPHTWTISRRVDSGWRPLEEEIAGDEKVPLAGGETYSWSFVEAVESIRIDPALDPGLYAAEIGVPDPESNEAWLACIALVRLTAAG